jgi:hypothetical protein
MCSTIRKENKICVHTDEQRLYSTRIIRRQSVTTQLYASEEEDPMETEWVRREEEEQRPV